MLKRGDKGQEVVKLQKAILLLGKKLPRFGADGALGDETLGAVDRVLADHGDVAPNDNERDVISDHELNFIYALLTVPAMPPDPPGLVDMRLESDRDDDRGPRSWKRVTGICIHQTACVFAETRERLRSVGAHIVVGRGGGKFWLHDFNRIVIHGHGFNEQCVGIEFNGTYAGIAGDERTLWKPATEPNRREMVPTPAMITAGHDVIRWIVARVAASGGNIRALVAHRQSSGTRQSAPGSAIWKSIVLPMQQELGLKDGGPTFKIGKGMTIPEAWNPAYKGNKY